jgi:hypothetical protein
MMGGRDKQEANPDDLGRYLTIPTAVASDHDRAVAAAVPGQPVQLRRDRERIAGADAIVASRFERTGT